MRTRLLCAALVALTVLTVALAGTTLADEPAAPPAAPTPTAATTPTATRTPLPTSPSTAFQLLWQRTDSAQVRGDRPYLWGPRPLLPIIAEPLAGAPGGQRLVVYWDKGRMEINDRQAPQGPWYVTSGRLVDELVTGREQVGVHPDVFAQRAPAAIPFGDLDDTAGPTFASFGGRLGDPPLAPGQPVAQGLDRAGTVQTADAAGVACQVVVAETRHCIAAPFWAFLNQTGPVDNAGKVQTGHLFDPLYFVTGLPISEAYWITVEENGRPTRVLIQLFERRTLTYNPANQPGAQVEMGNVGLEYYHWRYDALTPADPPTGLDPAMRQTENLIWGAAPAYQYLITNLAGGRFQLFFQDLSSADAYGETSIQYHAILLDSGFATADPHEAAVVLAHEAQHAYDLTAIGPPVTSDECVALEVRGFLVSAALWQTWYGPAGKPNPANTFDLQENAILVQIRTSPERFVQDLTQFYNEECGGLGLGAPDRFLGLAGLPAGIQAQLPVDRLFAAVRAPLPAASALTGFAQPPAASADGTLPAPESLTASGTDRGDRGFMAPGGP